MEETLQAFGVSFQNPSYSQYIPENSRWSIADNSTCVHVNWTLVSTTLGQQMPLSGGTEGVGLGYI